MDFSRGVGIGRVACPVALPLFLSNGPYFNVAHSFNGPDKQWAIPYGPYLKLAHGNILSKKVTFYPKK